jgi:hypothetical protein
VTEQRFPANWYPDPEGGTGLRFWDGTQWTEHRAAAPSRPAEASAAVASTHPAATSAPNASDAVNASSESTPTPKKRPGSFTILTLVVVIVLVIVVIAVVTTSSSDGSKAGSGNSSASSSNPVKTGLDHDAQVVQATVADVLIALGLTERHPTAANISHLAQVAQAAHDSLKNEKDTMALHLDTSNTNQAKLHDALNGLENSMGALVAYAETPNPNSLASFKKQYQPAAAKWNRAARAIYADTGRALPTIPIASTPTGPPTEPSRRVPL